MLNQSMRILWQKRVTFTYYKVKIHPLRFNPSIPGGNKKFTHT